MTRFRDGVGRPEKKILGVSGGALLENCNGNARQADQTKRRSSMFATKHEEREVFAEG
jgi:hypothetical protein